MTPAVNAAKQAGISFSLHEYEHGSTAMPFGLEAAEKLGLSTKQVFKTLVLDIGGNSLAVALIPVSAMLNTRHFARALGAKRAQMADPGAVERSTGYVLGGVSPLGQKKLLPTIIDESAKTFSSIYVSAGRRGLELELSADDLAVLTCGNFVQLCK